MININLIKFAFEGDDDISKYCDPEYKNKAIKKLIISIYKKLLDYEKVGDSTVSYTHLTLPTIYSV